MHIDFPWHELDLKAGFKKRYEADHADRVNNAAGDEGHGVIDGFQRRAGQKILSDVLPDFSLDFHGSVLPQFCPGPGNQSCPCFPWKWYPQTGCGRAPCTAAVSAH